MDIWALGVLAYSIIEGVSPFYDQADDTVTDEKLREQIKVEKITQNILTKELT